MSQAFKLLGDIVTQSAVASIANQGHKPSCRGLGCSHCCSVPVYATLGEIRHALEGIPDAERELLREKAERWAATFGASPLVKEQRPFSWDYQKLKLPCPFLKDGACSVYERRPMSCRTHFAVGPVEKCLTESAEDPQTTLEFDPQWCAKILQQMMLAGVDEHGSDVVDHLGAVLYFALTGKELRTAATRKVNVVGADLEISEYTDDELTKQNNENRDQITTGCNP